MSGMGTMMKLKSLVGRVRGRAMIAGWCLLSSVWHFGVSQAQQAERHAHVSTEETEGMSRSELLSCQEAASESVVRRRDESWAVAQEIWEAAEPGYQEVRSSALLSERLEVAGFRVTRAVAGIPTAFTAEFGSGTPVIGILGEFDALPGLSQQAVPERLPREDTNSYGHGCGHHLFGVASMSAAMAVADQIKQGGLKGTIRFYGCPAEEGGSAKVFMVREGLMKDCDAVLHWHPASRNSAGDRSSLARIAVKFQFRGKAAHAAGSPEQGRSALDAVALTSYAAELMREHTPDFTRIHHVITAGGEAPNVVPAFAEVYFYIRHPEADILKPLYTRLEMCAQAGAMGTGTELTVRYEGGIREIMPNQTLSAVVDRNLRRLNDLEYSKPELEFALRMSEQLPEPVSVDKIREVENVSGTVGKGSTDVGDVSWVVPTTGFSTACWVPGTPGHSWQAVACGGTTIAEKGMHLAARTLACTAVELMLTPSLLKAAQSELKTRTKGNVYSPLIPEGMLPPLDYRKPSRDQ